MSQKFRALRENSILLSPVMSELPMGIVKAGSLKKLKKMKRKFFILRKRYGGLPSKLEYYPSEKKWRLGCEPKRSIPLKSCFNISRKLHPKHKFVICLYTTEECFSIVLESEEEMNEWLSALLELQLNEIDADEEARSKLMFEHVWQVIVDDRELEFSRSLNGPYCLGLTSKALSLVKIGSSSENFECLDFPLMSIRRCGHSGKHFFIELGRSAVTGAGGIWMETEGTIVAQNMHETILGAMKSSRNKEDLGPHSRPRSASTSENSKPIATRRPVGVVLPQPTLNSSLTSSRERCNTTIPPRAQTRSESLQDAAYSLVSNSDSMGRHYYRENSRPHSVYAWPSSSSPTLSSFGFNTSGLSTSVYSNSSNISFDDPESPHATHMSWYLYGQPNDENSTIDGSITEVPNEYLMMSPTDDNMNIIPLKGDYLNMNPSGSQTSVSMEDNHLRSEPIPTCRRDTQVSDYMDMWSPSSTEGYIPMSRIGSLTTESFKRPSSNSLSESVGKGDDGYVPMAPCGASEEVSVPMRDGYLSMSPLSSSLPKRSSSGVFSHSSFNESNTSEDDSSEFKLDKVQSLVKESDEDVDQDFIKPVRAYSIGNRKQIYEARARAYSMGSERVRPEFVVTADSQGGNLKEANCTAKSNSAPVLQNSPCISHKACFEPVQECSCDLMEVTFQKQDYLANHNSQDSEPSPKAKHQKMPPKPRHANKAACSTSPLLSLNEVNESNGKVSHDAAQKDRHINSKLVQSPGESSGYVEMSRGADGFSIEQNRNIFTHESHIQGENIFKPSTQTASLSPKIPSSFTSLQSSSEARSIALTLSQAPSKNPGSLERKKEKCASSKNSFSATGLLSTNNANMKLWQISGLHNNQSDSNCLEVKGVGQGDYINLMLNKSQLSAPSSSETSKIDSHMGNAGEAESPPSEPDYMNIKLGKPFTPLPNPALVSSTNSQLSFSECSKENVSQREIHVRRSPVGEAHSSGASKSMATNPKYVSSLPIMKKQMSAPAVPPSLQQEHVSPGRKSSCPVTGSTSMMRSTAVPLATTSRLSTLHSTNTLLKALPSVSPERNSATQSDLEVSTKSVAHASQQNLAESQYENVNLLPNSRPGSVSSEKELNYASLDLAPTSAGEAPHSPSMLKLSHQSAIDDDGPLTYAEIDFTKSEGLRHTSGALREGRL